MGIFRLQDNVPETYINQSRDFQLLCRLFDCVDAGVRNGTTTMAHVVDTTTCVNRMVQLLQTKLGFFTRYTYNDDDIRAVLIGFPEMVKNKGTTKSIEEAIRVFLRLSGLNTVGEVVLDQISKSISIGLMTAPISTTILEEMLRYILPTGYFVDFYFYNKETPRTNLIVKNKRNTLNIANRLNSQLAALSSQAPNFNPSIDVESAYVREFAATPQENLTIPSGFDLLANSVGTTNILNQNIDMDYPSLPVTQEDLDNGAHKDA